MKKIFLLLPAVLLLASCGASKNATHYLNENEEAVEMGYGSIPKSRNTYAASNVRINENEFESYSNIYEYIRGRVPGVQVNRDNTIVIRGVSTINSSTEPLYIVDGVEVPDISYISPKDVKSISVLKDASSSIYGTRGGNGVIIITTKH